MPVWRVGAAGDGVVEGGVGPDGWGGGVAVFDRVEVDVIHVGGVVRAVADGVFPEAALPDAAFGFGGAACGAGFAGFDGAGKAGFDDLLAHTVIGVAFGQGPETVRVIGEDDPGVDVEGVKHAGAADGGAEGFDGAGEEVGSAVEKVDGEDVRASRDSVAAVVGHVGEGRGDCGGLVRG